MNEIDRFIVAVCDTRAEAKNESSSSARSRARFDALCALSAALARDEIDDVHACEDALIETISRAIGMASARAAMRALAIGRTRSGFASVHARANELAAACVGKGERDDQGSRAISYDALRMLVSEHWGRLSAMACAFAIEAGTSAKANEDAGTRRAALRFLSRACERSNGAMDERTIGETYKALVKIEGERDVGTRAARAEALGALARAWSATSARGRASGGKATTMGGVDIANVVQRILKAMEDECEWVRDSASRGLTAATLARAQAPQESSADQPHEGNAPSSGASFSFARAVHACLFVPLTTACCVHTNESRRARVGIARAWASFIREAAHEEVAEYHELVSNAVKLLFSQPYDDDPHVCASVLYVIRVGCLAKADEASLRATLATAARALVDADVARSLIALRTIRDTIEIIGSIGEELWRDVSKAVRATLNIDQRHVQTEAAQAMRALAVACPTKFVIQLCEAVGELETLSTCAEDGPSLAAFGTALHVAALVSIGEELSSGLPSGILRDSASVGIRCATGPGSARVREGGWIVISACLAGSGAEQASKMCATSIAFALTATFDAVVQGGTESEHGEIYAAAAAVETLSAWLIGKQTDTANLMPLLLSGITAAERIMVSSSVETSIEHAKALFRFRIFELLNTIEDTSIYSALHERIVALCRMRMSSYSKLDECLPEGFLREQLSTEDAHLGPWSSRADVHLDQLHEFEGTPDAPHSRIWIDASESHVYPRARSMKASTRQAQGEQLAKVFSTAPALQSEILSNFISLAHSIMRTPEDQKREYEEGTAPAVIKKKNAIELIHSRFGSPFKSRLAQLDYGEKVERLAALTLLCADVLAAVKGVSVANEELMRGFRKIANIMQYADFASTMHWRAIAEVHAFANALNPTPDGCAKDIVKTSMKLLTMPKECALRNIVALSIAGTFRNTGAIAMNQACQPVITNLLQVSMQIDNVFSSHVWAIHAISEIGTQIGQSFVREADDTVALALAIVDAPFLLEQQNGAMTRVVTARLVNTAIAAVGPDLDHDSVTFKRAEMLIAILGESDAPAAKLESTMFLQHIATFTPHTTRGQALVPKLREMLRLTSDASTTNAVMLILRHLLERDSAAVAAHVGLDTELLTVLDRESDPKTRSTIKRCVELLVHDKCLRNPLKTLTMLSTIALYSQKPVGKQNSAINVEEDDEAGGTDIAVADAEEQALGVERGAPKLSTRLYAAQLLVQVPMMLSESAHEHRCLAAARSSVDAGKGDHWFALHAQTAFDVAYRLSVSPVAALHAPGLELFANLMNLWAGDADPDSVSDGDLRTLFVLEQYQAQLLSAMRATDPAHASIESFLALLRLVSSALTSGITGDDAAITKRLANVVTAIANEWRQGTSEILCGKACADVVAEQARRTLIINIARIAANDSAAISSDVLTWINAEWIKVIRDRSAWSSSDEVVSILSACSTLQQTAEDNNSIREMCFMAMICGFSKPKIPSSADFEASIRALTRLITVDTGCIVASEVDTICNALRLHETPEVCNVVATFVTHVLVSGAVHLNAYASIVKLVAHSIARGHTSDAVVESLMPLTLQMSSRNTRVQGAVMALIESIFTEPCMHKYRIIIVRGFRSLDSNTMIMLLRGVGHVLATSARVSTREFYANKLARKVQSADALDLVTESLQLWASAFLAVSVDESDSMCTTSLAIFLALAVDVAAPENVNAKDVDATVGQTASQLMIRLAAVSARPFRDVVGQLSPSSKMRLQNTLTFKAPQFVAAQSTPIKLLNVSLKSQI